MLHKGLYSMLIKFIGNLVFPQKSLLTTVKCVSSTLMAIKRLVFIIELLSGTDRQFRLATRRLLRRYASASSVYEHSLLAYRNASPDAENFTRTVIKTKQPYPRIVINISYAA